MREQLDNISIRNYKSINQLTIENCRRINVFIGKPNVGKSAVLEAISFGSYLKPDYSESLVKLFRFRLLNELFHFGKTEEPIAIQSSAFSLKFSLLNDRSARLEALSNTHNATFNIDFLSKGDFALNPPVDFPYIIFPTIKKYCFATLYESLRTDSRTLIAPHGQNLVDVLLTNEELRKEVVDFMKEYSLKLNIDTRDFSIRGYMELPGDLVYTIPLYQMADTLQRLIFYKAAIASNTDTVLLFEEPEAHMFPPYISSFITGDIALKPQNGNQYFIATHSPFVIGELLEHARPELSIYAIFLKNGATAVRRLTDDEMQEVWEYGVDLFFNLESYLREA